MDVAISKSRWSWQADVFSKFQGVSLEKTSSLFLAGLGLMLVSSVTSSIWSWLRQLWKSFESSVLTTMELNSRDESYSWLIEWINFQPWAKRFRQVSVSTTYVQYDEGDNRPVLLYTPDVGHYMIRYKGQKIWLTRTRDESNTADTLAHFGGVYEKIRLTTWGNRREILQDLINEAMEMYLKKEEGKTVIYTAAHGSWQRFGPARPVRPLDSVILEDGQAELLISDTKEFLSSSDWYAARGIPYRRGYLLYGPPGTGKTSFVTALAGHLGMSICVVNLNNPDLSDEQLVMLLNKTPGKKCVILIEDVDAAPAALSRAVEYPSNRSNENITLSGLLNALDGVASQEGRLLFMTTNHIERLDPALSRPGRIDVKMQLGYARRSQFRRMFLNFYPGQNLLAMKFAESIPESQQMTTADIQSFFMNYKSDPNAAVANVHKVLEGSNSSSK